MWGKVSRRGSGLEGPLSGGEGERVASSTSGGVFSNKGTREGEGKGGRSGSKFKNSVQSESKVRCDDCNRSSCGISNRAENSSNDTGIAISMGGAGNFNVSVARSRRVGVKLTGWGRNRA